MEIVSLVPSFELGLWNAWILLVHFILFCYLRDVYIGFLHKRESSNKEGSASRSYVGLERMYMQLLMVIMGILLLYSVFLPLAIGTVWFYAGLAVYLTGWTFMVLATLVFIATPADKPNTTGIYSISRHPIYLGWFSIFISMGIASASWVYILLALISLVPIRNALMIPEERACCERFGNAYTEYMNKTPRWLGIPKSEKIENT